MNAYKCMYLQVGDFPKDTVYIRNLKLSGRYYSLQCNDTFVVAECDDKGLLQQGYCLVQKKIIRTTDSEFTALICSCQASKQQRLRLFSLPSEMSEEDFKIMTNQETSEYRIHCQSVKVLFTTSTCALYTLDCDDSDEEEVKIDVISLTPPLISVFDGSAYGLAGHKRTKKLCCLICEHECDHVALIQDWCSSRNVYLDSEEPLIEESNFISVSYNLIPYPLPRSLRLLHDRHEMGKWKFPLHLIPPTNESSVYVHGNIFNSDDPVTHNWISRKGVLIHKEAVTIEDSERTVYYRPTSGSCKCRQEYDGQEDLLFNLDGEHYGFLLQYLHLMLEGRNPLMTFYRASCKSFYIQSLSKPVHIKLLRQAWNAFSRLLDVDWREAFNCHQCGLTPQIVICDGTLIGYRKEFSSQVIQDEKVIKGSEHGDRILLKSFKSRELLLKYSGYSKQRKCLAKSTGLTLAEFSQLQKLCRKEGCSELAELINYLSTDRNPKISPVEYMEFFNELSHCSPVCETFQVAGNSQVMEAIEKVCAGLDIKHPAQLTHLKVIQEHAPVLADVLLKCSYPLPMPFLNFIKLLKSYVVTPFDKEELNHSDTGSASKLTYFPNHPPVRGVRKYLCDSKSLCQQKDSCRKHASHHPTLTPGIFTLYCPHGICYGFEVMRSYESPRIPFQIFLTRFLHPPKVIIYDNACKLHQYILNREPDHFKATKFLVDRFHWRGHVGCSSGYNLSKYPGFDMGAINSQVNEQANAGLQRIKAHISYMKEDNFMFHVKLFLALTNNRKQQMSRE